ncbi:MAG: RNA polymerase III RPC4-domain-containing protein [Linnemannia gamsii]|nr:hypothetical protein BGX24_001501 [Mortierella sp. AD032]KAK3843254.1 MAG: RNA polymerase III RPC4-domain-containing protein [Linnemannia gamsii]
MSDESGNQRPAASASASASATGSIGSLHTPTVTPAGRLTSLRGGRGGAGAASAASTRGGASKLKFAPTVPSKRNKKDASLSLLEEAKAGSGSGTGFEERGAGRGRGERGGRGMRGSGRGRGRGRPDDVAATASGPFSLGPAAQARSRAIATGGSASGAHSSYTGAPTVKYEGEGGSDYGASVDMKFGSSVTDASVPTGLESPNDDKKAVDKKAVGSSIKDEKMKERDMDEDMDGREIETDDQPDIKPKIEGPAQDLLPDWEYDQMYFFQFPSVMPTFRPRPVTTAPMSLASTAVSSPNVSSLYSTPDGTDKTEDSEDGLLAIKPEPMDQDRPIMIPDSDLIAVKSEQQDAKVGLSLGEGGSSSAPVGQRAKPKAPGSGAAKTENKEEETEESHLQQEGKIGRLLIYKSGKVKMKVGDILMDVSSGSECSFLQDLVVVDSNNKQAFVMGSVEKRMVCVPNLTELLNGLEGLDI